MGTKVKKGFLKPIRYISQMFDGNKEPEMQIGLPTDIKHVAHIGCDGPNANAPTWMKDYHSAPINPTFEKPAKEDSAPKWGSQGSDFLGGGLEEGGSPAVAEESAPPTKPKHTRRHKSDETSKNTGDDSETGEETKKHRKHRKRSDSAGGSQDMPSIPKQSHRRRKSKDSGSAKPSKNKASKHGGGGEKSGGAAGDED